MFDYVFLKLKTKHNLEDMYGSFGLDFDERKPLQSGHKTICGYP